MAKRASWLRKIIRKLVSMACLPMTTYGSRAYWLTNPTGDDAISASVRRRSAGSPVPEQLEMEMFPYTLPHDLPGHVHLIFPQGGLDRQISA